MTPATKMFMNTRFRSLINIVLLFAVLTINYLANALPINGVTQKQLSAEYTIHLTPAGYVFAIWGVIYLGLMVFVVIQALPSHRSKPRIRTLDLPFGLSCTCNALWLIFWHHRQLALSMLLMLGLLGSLMLAYTRLEKHRESKRAFIDVTFSVYLGWVGLATILNMAIWLNSLGWTGAPLAPQTWAGIMLGVACALYLYLGFAKRDIAIVSVLAWASLGIAIKNQAEFFVWYSGLTVCTLCVVGLLLIALRANATPTDSRTFAQL